MQPNEPIKKKFLTKATAVVFDKYTNKGYTSNNKYIEQYSAEQFNKYAKIKQMQLPKNLRPSNPQAQSIIAQKFTRKNTTATAVTAYFFSESQEKAIKQYNESGQGIYHPSYFRGQMYSDFCTIQPGDFIRPTSEWADLELVGTDPDILQAPIDLDF